MIAASDITGLVLSGGRATRMGGVDKGLQLFAGMPLAQHAAQRLAAQCGTVAINANRYLDVYQSFGYLVWADAAFTSGNHDAEPADWQGPLAGMCAGLSRCTTPWLATVPCDSPLFPHDVVRRLAQAASAQSVGTVMAAVAAPDDEPRNQPVFSLLHVEVLDSLRRYLEGGGRKTGEWLRSQQCAVVVFDDAEQAFANVNTLAELGDLQAHAR